MFTPPPAQKPAISRREPCFPPSKLKTKAKKPSKVGKLAGLLLPIMMILGYYAAHAQYGNDSLPPCGYDLIFRDSLPRTLVPQGFARSHSGPYIIPVVVHIVHEDGPENISDAQVLSAIQTMNAQFSGADGGPDSEIEFRLATRDPQGNCTNGIDRIYHQPAGVHVKAAASNVCTLSGLDLYALGTWPLSKYMNIWVVEKIQNNPQNPNSCNDTGIRGFTNDMGIVVKYKHFGTVETAFYGNESENMNTDTHEAGHFLGLTHPWGPVVNLGTCTPACENEDCHTDGDAVCDTDPCNGPGVAMDCNNPPLSCTTCEDFDFTDYVNPIDNYMSYSTLCQYRFTPGQTERMHGVLEADFPNLYSSSNLTATGTSDAILGGQLVLAPTIFPADCPDQNNGSISVSVSNGSGSYWYLWNTGATTAGIAHLTPGWYSVEVTDNSSSECAKTASFYVPGATLSFDIVKTCVQSSEGAIDITVYGAGGNVLNDNTYLWSNGATTEDLSGLPAGEYSVMVTTVDGCTIEQSFEVKFIQRPIIDVENDVVVENTGCFGQFGSIYTDINSAGTAMTFIYHWTDSTENTVGSTQHLENVPPGTYTLTVTNPYSGCTSAETDIEILGPQSFTHPNLLTISGTQTINTNLSFVEGINILDGGILTIENATVEFAEGAVITVQPGGRLDIVDSHLKNRACAEFWQGIYVFGNENLSQSGPDAAEQGKCLIDNSVIDKARMGIANGGPSYYDTNHGGIIFAVYATFRNCRISAQIEKYQHIADGVLQPIKCKFFNSQFVWDEDFPFVDDANNPMVRLREVFRVKFQGCSFTNFHKGLFTPPNNSPFKAAIFCNWASIDVEGGCEGYPPYAFDSEENCIGDVVPSGIHGLNYGIVMRKGQGSSITETTFDCYRGLWAYNSQAVRLTQNDFHTLPASLASYAGQTDPMDDPPWNIAYGAYFEFSSGFWIEDNAFNLNAKSVENAGLLIRNSGDEHNRVNGNNFINNSFGVVAYDDNRGSDDFTGLNIECNTFTGSKEDILVTSTTDPTGQWGISYHQGSPDNSAGNHFLDQPSFNVANELEPVIYHYHQNENLTSTIGVTKVLTNAENGCPSSFDASQKPYSEERTQAILLQSKADSIGSVLSTIIDAGNTPAMINEVVLANFSEAVELYYDLMLVSPNLSKEVMLEAIQKEYELPADLLTLILNANPHAAKLSNIQNKLDERVQQLTEAQRALIDEGLDITSYKEGLEAQMSHLEAAAKEKIDRIVIDVLADTASGNKIQMIKTHTAGFESANLSYLLVDLALQRGDLVQAQALLDGVASLPLTDAGAEEYPDYQIVYGILLDVLAAGDSVLSPSDYQVLQDLTLNKPHSHPAAMAVGLLERYTGMGFHEKLIAPQSQNKAIHPQRIKPPLQEIKKCRVYPNPTEGILMLEISGEYSQIYVEVVDTKGRVIYTANRETGKTGLSVLNLRPYTSGMYLLRISNASGNLNEIHRVTLKK